MTERQKLVTLGGFFLLAIIAVPFAVEHGMARNPPAWYLKRHQTSRSLHQQTDPVAQIVVTGSELNGVYIPPNLEVETGGDGVLVKGPAKDIYDFHRKLYRLDEPRTGVLGLFEWRTE